MEEHKNRPSHRAYVVRRREGEDEHWRDIGIAFSHRDGNGLTIVFDAVPLDGKVILRKCYYEQAE